MSSSQNNVDVEKAFEENSLQLSHSATPAHRRIKVLAWIPNSARNHSIAFIGEFVGTFLFLFFAFAGTQVANTAASNITTATPELAGNADVSVVIFIALSFGFSLMVNAWVFFRISGGLFNPAVSVPYLSIHWQHLTFLEGHTRPLPHRRRQMGSRCRRPRRTNCWRHSSFCCGSWSLPR